MQQDPPTHTYTKKTPKFMSAAWQGLCTCGLPHVCDGTVAQITCVPQFLSLGSRPMPHKVTSGTLFSWIPPTPFLDYTHWPWQFGEQLWYQESNGGQLPASTLPPGPASWSCSA